MGNQESYIQFKLRSDYLGDSSAGKELRVPEKDLNTKCAIALMETSHPGIMKKSITIKPSDFSLLLVTHEASFWSQARQLRLIGKES